MSTTKIGTIDGYSGEVEVSLGLPREGADGPALVFVESGNLGRLVLTREQTRTLIEALRLTTVQMV